MALPLKRGVGRKPRILDLRVEEVADFIEYVPQLSVCAKITRRAREVPRLG